MTAKVSKKNSFSTLSYQVLWLGSGIRPPRTIPLGPPFAKILGQLDPNFIPNIEKQYPDISKTELRLACFIKLKMSAEEISRVMNISTSSFYTLRYRLRKRLGLKGNESLESIIDSF